MSEIFIAKAMDSLYVLISGCESKRKRRKVQRKKKTREYKALYDKEMMGLESLKRTSVVLPGFINTIQPAMENHKSMSSPIELIMELQKGMIRQSLDG